MAPIIICISIFLLYKFIVNFILPVYRASKQVQAQFRNMQQGRDTAADPLHASQQKPANSHKKSADYIDFEEVKD